MIRKRLFACADVGLATEGPGGGISLTDSRELMWGQLISKDIVEERRMRESEREGYCEL